MMIASSSNGARKRIIHFSQCEKFQSMCEQNLDRFTGKSKVFYILIVFISLHFFYITRN